MSMMSVVVGGDGDDEEMTSSIKLHKSSVACVIMRTFDHGRGLSAILMRIHRHMHLLLVA